MINQLCMVRSLSPPSTQITVFSDRASHPPKDLIASGALSLSVEAFRYLRSLASKFTGHWGVPNA